MAQTDSQFFVRSSRLAVYMSTALTSWKEVAEHLGKGVRTVQRWERQMGLPVRRPSLRKKGVVLAFPEELDVWVRSQFQPTRGQDVQTLRRELAELKKENQLLRAELQRVQRGVIRVPGGRVE